MGYRDFIKGLAPAWLRNAVAQMWLDVFGQAMDDAIARAQGAAQLKSPTSPTTDLPPEDRLLAIGGERQIIRGYADTLTAFSDKLVLAWERWYYGGTALGLLRVLNDLGYTQAKVMIRNRIAYSLDGSGNLVRTTLPAGSWFTGSGFWNEFDIFFAVAPTPGTGAPSDWSVALPSPTSDEVLALKKQIALWKPAHARACRIVVLGSGNLWGWPTSLTWGAGGLTWGGGSSSTITLNF